MLPRILYRSLSLSVSLRLSRSPVLSLTLRRISRRIDGEIRLGETYLSVSLVLPFSLSLSLTRSLTQTPLNIKGSL
jgi:hypothetical protein